MMNVKKKKKSLLDKWVEYSLLYCSLYFFNVYLKKNAMLTKANKSGRKQHYTTRYLHQNQKLL